MKVCLCLWLCIYLCLLVLILISCRIYDWINGLNYCFFNASPATALAAGSIRLAHTGSLFRSLATIPDVDLPHLVGVTLALVLKGMLLAWWISPYLVRGFKLINRLDQLELHKEAGGRN